MNEASHPLLPEGAELLHGRAVIEAAIGRMAGEIDQALAGTRPLLLVVMHGGMPFATQLALAMKLDLDLGYVHATRYRGDTRGRALEWKSVPSHPVAGRTVLIADDILDEGHTLKALREACLAEGAGAVYIAVLCEKRHGRRVAGLDADFVGLQVPDRYVFGYGMDMAERLRHLPGIYALKDDEHA